MTLALSAFDLVPSSAKYLEWLIASGNGAYSSSTVIGMNSRKYHGLLIAPLEGHYNRHIILSKLEEEVTIGEKTFPISTNSYPGVIYPTGYKFQVGFFFRAHPTFVYALDSVKLEKSVRMLYGKSTAVISYRIAQGKESVKLSISPLLAPRQIHADFANTNVEFQKERGGVRIVRPISFRLCASHGNFEASPQQYYNMTYEIEKERGYYYTENLFCPGKFIAELGPKEELHVVASVEGILPSEALEILDRQQIRQAHLLEGYSRTSGVDLTDFAETLNFAADTFVIGTESHKGILAGYHWFHEWGRDSMIALPGLLLCTGRHALAREVLSFWARMMQDGLIPNYIDENNFAHYTSSDASLWFLNAVGHYLDATEDENFVKEHLWKYIREVINSYVEGNRLARMDSDFLIYVFEPASTWMDAKVNGVAVTPRKGKPVEINALWYSGLSLAFELAERFEDRKTYDLVKNIIDEVELNFQKFVSTEGWLFDVIEPNDASFRPNQIFSVALYKSPLNSLQQKYVFNTVRSKLYTPLGLRTLSPDDKRYCEHYRGNQESRDRAYHQGMIWPWLLGPFYDAQLKVYPESYAQVLSALRPLAEKLKEGCIGSLPEMYEPASGKPAGAASQAWSVAEILRIYTKVKKAISQNPRIAIPNYNYSNFR